MEEEEKSFEALFSGYKDLCAQYEAAKSAEHLSEAQAASLGREARLVLEFGAKQRALEEEIARLREENAELAQSKVVASEESAVVMTAEREELDMLKAENAKLLKAKAADEEEREELEGKLVVSRRNYREALNEVELITEQLKMAERELQDANERITALEQQQRKGRRKSGTGDCDSSVDSSSYGLSGKELKKKNRERSFVLDHFERALTGIDDDDNNKELKRTNNDDNGGGDNEIRGRREKKMKISSKEDDDSSLSIDKSPSEKPRQKAPLFGTPETAGGDDSIVSSTTTKTKKSVKKKGMNYASFLQKNKGITIPKIKLN